MANEETENKKNEWAMPIPIMVCFFIEGVWTLSNAWDLIATHKKPRYISFRDAGVIDILGGLRGNSRKTYVAAPLLIIEGIFFIVIPFYIEFVWKGKNHLNAAQKRFAHHSAIWMPIVFLLLGASVLSDQQGYVAVSALFTLALFAAAIWSRISEPKDEVQSEVSATDHQDSIDK